MEGRLRICLISFLFWPDIGGAQTRAEKLARQLQRQGHDAIIVTLRHERGWKRIETIDGLTILRVGGFFKHTGRLRIGRFAHLPIDIGVFFMLWRLRHCYNLMHVCQLSTLAGVAVLIGKLWHKPVVISIQSAGPDQKQDAQMLHSSSLMPGKLATHRYLKLASKEIVVGDIAHFPQTAFGGQLILDLLRRSDAYFQVLSRRSHLCLINNGFRAEQIVTIPNGIDSAKFRPASTGQPLPIKPERDIICVARLEYPKGLDVLLHAWSHLLASSDDWRTHLKLRLRLVGDGTLRTQLELLAEDLGIRDSVEFLGLHTDIVSLLQQAWGFVLPSRWEGMPNALLEAMGCGLPCIATRVSGSEEILLDGINGLLVEPEQPVAMAHALRRIIVDPEFAHRIALEGRKTILRDYQLATVVEDCLKLYREILTKEHDALPRLSKGKE